MPFWLGYEWVRNILGKKTEKHNPSLRIHCIEAVGLGFVTPKGLSVTPNIFQGHYWNYGENICRSLSGKLFPFLGQYPQDGPWFV